jgi:hypothetical protein
MRILTPSSFLRWALVSAVATAALGSILLAAVSTARGAPGQPAVTLGPITVSDGVATLSGSLGPGGTAAAEVTVNGQRAGVDTSGAFQAVVNLGGASQIVFSAKNPTNGERYTITIPLGLAGPDGVISDPLALLRQAGISVTVPPGGFTALDGQPLTVLGRVLNPDALSSFAVNGREILGAIAPSGAFSETTSSSSREVSVSATDTRGVAQTSTFPVAQVSSVIQTAAGKTVSAVGARGLRISGVRYLTKGIAKTRRLQMVALRLRPQVFSKRLSVATLARTPNARAEKVTSVRLPKLVKPRARRI